MKTRKAIAAYLRRRSGEVPRRISIDASTVCQLKCPSCPTTAGEIRKHLKSGFLKLRDFETLIEANPEIRLVEFSNWGEVLLNPEIVPLLEYAARKNVAIGLGGGVNFNTVKPDVMRALVRFKVRFLTCSIDAASPETYKIYRIGGDFGQVISNIERLNELKREYGSRYPELTWQYVAFDHNLDEIELARNMAQRLGMNFEVKLNWNDLFDRPFSIVSDRSRVASESSLGAGDRVEYEQRHGTPYKQNLCCGMMWTSPQLNFDGRVLGCPVNYWGDYGNALSEGLAHTLNGERMRYAKGMLTGDLPERDDIPCTSCKLYCDMKASKNWVRPEELSLWRPTLASRVSDHVHDFGNAFGLRGLMRRFARA
jgi:hypothetical protein